MKKMLSSFFGLNNKGSESKPVGQTKNTSKRQAALQALKQLEPLLEKRYNPMYASAIMLEVLTTDIRKFNLMLRNFNMTLRDNEVIQKTDCVFTKTQSSLDKFFTDEDRRYIGQEELKSFFAEATRLCELTATGETAEWGNEEHNFRILTKVFVGIKQVCDAVVAINNMR